jgi:putative transposase
LKAYRTEVDPNNVQWTAFLRHAGAARWAYNWGLRQKIERYEQTGKSPSAIDLHCELNVLKKTAVPWMYEVSKCAPQEALRNLDKAFDGFFRRCKSSSVNKGYPRFKSRKRGIGTFTLTGGIRVTNNTIKLPRIGTVRLKEHGYFPVGVKIVAAVVSERVGRWFVTIRTLEVPQRPLGTEILGVDVGVKELAVLSDGTTFTNPKALKTAKARLKRLQQAVSRKQKGSANRRKAILRLGKQHYRVTCVRNDAIHKCSNAITKRAHTVVIESLNVAGMLKNHCLAKAISDAGMAELHRQITYKMAWAGGVVIQADRWYPSSKTCSACGLVKDDLTLTDRVFRCECGFKCDRDHNAAINLRNLAASSAVTACGEDCAGGRPTTRVKRSSVKQEPNTERGLSSSGLV